MPRSMFRRELPTIDISNYSLLFVKVESKPKISSDHKTICRYNKADWDNSFRSYIVEAPLLALFKCGPFSTAYLISELILSGIESIILFKNTSKKQTAIPRSCLNVLRP